MDMWQPEWIASMQEWGNERAADQWEYHLPDDFSRPAGSDQAMDQFIRNKYVTNSPHPLRFLLTREH